MIPTKPAEGCRFVLQGGGRCRCVLPYRRGHEGQQQGQHGIGDTHVRRHQRLVDQVVEQSGLENNQVSGKPKGCADDQRKDDWPKGKFWKKVEHCLGLMDPASAAAGDAGLRGQIHPLNRNSTHDGQAGATGHPLSRVCSAARNQAEMVGLGTGHHFRSDALIEAGEAAALAGGEGQ